ncbi:MAG: hypothetical protein RR365_06450 [Bacteroides sp.]
MYVQKVLRTVLNLHLFDGEAAAAEAPAVETAKADKNSLANIQYGKQTEEPAKPAAQEGSAKKEPETRVTSDTEEARKTEFEKLIKGDYRDLFDARVKQNIDARFKETETLRTKAAQVDTLAPVLDMLFCKYGVDGSDISALTKAIEDDDSFYEEEAARKGLTKEQYKAMQKLERENAEFKHAAQEQQRKQNADRIFAQWTQQSEALKQVYPNFDLQSECSSAEYGSRFLGLLKSGIDVKTAYEVIHKDDIIGGAMQYTAQKVQQKTVNDIKARGMRPSENGGSGNAPSVIRKADPSKLTNKDLAEISKRVRAGERIEF